MRAIKWKSVSIIFLLAMVLVHTVALWQMRDLILQGYGDFVTFYTAGTIVHHGQAARLYDLQLQWQAQQDFPETFRIRRGPLPYFHPPFEALIFLPLTYLSYPAACVAWLGLKLLILFLIPRLLAPFVPGGPLLPAPLLGFLSLAFFPVAADLFQGQDSILLLLAFTLAFREMQRTNDFRAGLFLGLGLVRFHLVIPVALVFLLIRKTKFFVGFMSAALFLFLISAALMGWHGILEYPKYLLNLNQPDVGLITPEIMPNLRGLVATIFGRAPLGLFATVAIFGILVTAWLCRNIGSPELKCAGYSLALVTTLLTSYYGYSFDMIVLLIPMLLVGGSFLRATELAGARPLFLACAGLLWFSPMYWFLILRTRQFYWVAFSLLLLLAVSLVWAMNRWRTVLST